MGLLGSGAPRLRGWFLLCSWLALAAGCAPATPPAAGFPDGGPTDLLAPTEDAGGRPGEPVDAVRPEAPDDGSGPGDGSSHAGEPDLADGGVPDGHVADVAGLPLPPPGPGFHRRGSGLLDPAGRTLLLHGVNIANHSKWAPDHLPWQGPTELTELAARGFDSVRLLTFWGAIMPEEGVLDEVYLAGFLQRVDWAGQAGLLVIVDMHQDLFGFGFGDNGAPRWACDEELYASYRPRQPWYLNYLAPEVQACFDRFYADPARFGRFQEAWVALAARLADHPAVLGFDLLNEPSWGSGSADAFVPEIWQPRLEQLAAAIHAVAPHRPVFYQGTTLASLGHVDAWSPPADPRLAFGPHYYHPLVHDGAAFTPEYLPALDRALDALGQMAAALGDPPVWVGEFGGPVTAPGFPDYLEALLERFAVRRWGWAYYSDDRDGFGIRQPDGSFREEVVARLGHPTVRRVPGTLLDNRLDFGVGQSLARFRWEVAAPLVLWVGPAGSAAVEGPGGLVPCEASATGPAGLLECPASAPVRFGEVYTVRLAGR